MKNGIWLGIFWAILVTIVYGLRKVDHTLPWGDLYIILLFLLPVLLLIIRQETWQSLGLKIGSPGTGIFLALLLPLILFLRFYLGGETFDPSLLRPWLVFGLTLPGFLLPTVIGPAAEEIFFRGYLQQKMAVRFGEYFGIAMAAAFFALIHLVKGYPLLGTLGIFVIGAYFGLTRSPKGGGSLFYSIIAHGLYNGVLMVFR